MPRTILVVDDVEDFRLIAGLYLSRAGFSTSFAENGLQALEYLNNRPTPEAIVLDIRMPMMNGWEFLDQQRKDKRLSAIPVIIYSNESMQLLEQHLRLGIASIVSKSSPSCVFIEAVRSAIAVRKAGRH